MSNKVVITGLELITALGLDLKQTWEKLLLGKSGVKRITLFDPEQTATKIAAEVQPEFEDYSRSYCNKRLSGYMTRVTKMGYVCAQKAIESSGIDFDKQDKTRCAVVLGVVDTAFSSIERKRSGTKNRIVKKMANAPSAWISLKYGLEGPNYPICTACSSSAYAMAHGYELIKQDEADIVLVGGTDSIVDPDNVNGFNEIYALSLRNDEPEKASRPFTKDRDGFVIGEGAAMLVLESEKSAIARGAEIFAEFAGYSMTSESYNIMSPKKNGVAMARTMELAINRSGIRKDEIDYINAHGTSTPLNDKYETMAIKSVFGERAYSIPVSSSKSMLGHTIGAAGAIEAVITVMSLKTGIVTPTINYDNPDEELDLDYVPNVTRNLDIRAALSNSFAFGGHNATIVLRKYENP
jgi:3-oxoacyl-[acyl-carrier-protein] synthase II